MEIWRKRLSKILQKYYDVTIGKDYLCVFANKWNPNSWLGSYNSICIHNKTKNDRVRKNKVLQKVVIHQN